MKDLRYMYLMLALCLPYALVSTAFAVWLDRYGLVWVALIVLLATGPPYALGAVKLMQRIEARRE